MDHPTPLKIKPISQTIFRRQSVVPIGSEYHLKMKHQSDASSEETSQTERNKMSKGKSLFEKSRSDSSQETVIGTAPEIPSENRAEESFLRFEENLKNSQVKLVALRERRLDLMQKIAKMSKGESPQEMEIQKQILQQFQFELQETDFDLNLQKQLIDKMVQSIQSVELCSNSRI